MLIAVIGMLLTLTSCWDRHELNEIAIAVGMGLDRQGDGIQVTMQLVNPGEVASSKAASGYSPPVTIFSETEATTLEAIRKLTTSAPRQIVSSHLRILVISEQLAKEGIAELLDGISRYYEMRSDFNIIVARQTSAEHVLGILTPIEKIPANRIFSTLEMSEKIWAPTTTIQLDRFIDDISDPTKDAVLTGIRIIGDEEQGMTLKNLQRSKPYARLQYSGIALFKNDKLVDWLDKEESKGYNYIMDNVNNTIGHVTCPHGGIVGVAVTRSKTNVKAIVDQGKPEILINLHLEQNISEVRCRIDLTKLSTINNLEKLSEQELKGIIKAAIHKAKKNHTDIFGFGEKIEDASPKSWLKLKDDWDQEFADVDVTIHVDVKIRRLGTINNSLLERKE